MPPKATDPILQRALKRAGVEPTGDKEKDLALAEKYILPAIDKKSPSRWSSFKDGK